MTPERLAEIRANVYGPAERGLLAEVDRLTAREVELVGLLRSVEWRGKSGIDGGPACPVCYWPVIKTNMGFVREHQGGCRLAAALGGQS